MEVSDVAKSLRIDGFRQILLERRERVVVRMVNAIYNIDKSNEKLELQLNSKELLMNMEGAFIDYNYSTAVRGSLKKKLKSKARCEGLPHQCVCASACS